ncbi:C40 family peptidase [Nafulsella turpanensis]|uniref:C40 family peptidase n=1 Tax=Nafulsella turpanensis TaxID=1265690 RepID=UPI00034496E1|nr:C40 family peptidase [Nafulsella turpanensis]
MHQRNTAAFRGFYLLFTFCLLSLTFSSCSSSKSGSRSVSAKKADSQQQKVISTARSFIGTPYKWGGTTRSGMDCSGLLVTSFRAAGIDLPRTSAGQSDYGRSVSIYELQPGDLVFFAANKRRGKITHVGMVTEVRGRNEVLFIHASSSLGVVEANLHSDYYRKIYRKAQRPF